MKTQFLSAEQRYIDDKIKNLLQEPGSRVSIVGIGGSGKSQLAFKALHKYYEKDAITDLVVSVYLSAIVSTTSTDDNNKDGRNNNKPTVLTFKRFLTEIGSELIKQNILQQISEQDFEQLDINKGKSLIYDALATKNYPILYCDNFETLSNELEEKKGGNKDIKDIFNFLNGELPSNTSILVTSRNIINFLSNENRIDLEGLKIEEGMQVFTEHASTFQHQFSNPDNNETKLLRTLVTKTGGHPLSIEILAKTYKGGGETELQKMSETLGQQRDNPWGKEERHENLHKCFNYSIEKLDKNLQYLLPALTIFHSPFPSEAVEKIFGILEAGELLVELYNKSLLSRMETDDESRPFSSSNFWLYSMHLALRNYLEDKYKNIILNKETESIPYFCNYYYDLVTKTYDAWGKDDHKDLIRQFVQMTKSENNDYDRAIVFAIHIQGKEEKLGKEIGTGIASYLGLLHENLGYYNRSLLYHNNALRIHKELGDRVGMAKDYSNIGLVYYLKGQLDDALQYYKKALEIDEELKDRVGMAKGYNNIGLVYYLKGQLDDALQYYKKALEIDEELGDWVGMAKDYSNIGLVYYRKGQLDDALQYYKKALKIDEELGDIVNLVLGYCNIGYTYIAKNDKNEATIAANNALNIVKEFETKTGHKHPLVSQVEELVSSLK